MRKYAITKRLSPYSGTREYLWEAHLYSWIFGIFGASKHTLFSGVHSFDSADHCETLLVAELEKIEKSKYEIVRVVTA